jgi:protein-tyrosine phosphatase
MIYKIIDNLYISNILFSLNNLFLNENKISTIFRIHDNDEEFENLYPKNIKLIKFNLEDNALNNISLIKFGDLLYNYTINHPTKNILVCCRDGASCSVALVIFYLITKYHYNVKNSLSIIKNIKINASINNGFINTLNIYYYRLKENNFIKTNDLLKLIIFNEKNKFNILVKN